MDLKLETEEFKFKSRACGLIINDDKVLMCCINDNNFWCAPGGHIHLGESSTAGVLREIEEEVGIAFNNASLVSLVENFFEDKSGKHFHEYAFFYLMEGFVPVDKQCDREIVENDEGELVSLKFKWIPLGEVENYDIRPNVLKPILQSRDFSCRHIVLRNDKIVSR